MTPEAWEVVRGLSVTAPVFVVALAVIWMFRDEIKTRMKADAELKVGLAEHLRHAERSDERRLAHLDLLQQKADRALDRMSAPDRVDDRRTPVIHMGAIACLLALGGCAHMGEFGRDATRAFLDRVDVTRVVGCAGLPSPPAAAICLGASVVRPGLHALVDALAARLERLSSAQSGGGAQDDLSPAEQRRLRKEAGEMVEELRAMGAEI